MAKAKIVARRSTGTVCAERRDAATLSRLIGAITAAGYGSRAMTYGAKVPRVGLSHGRRRKRRAAAAAHPVRASSQRTGRRADEPLVPDPVARPGALRAACLFPSRTCC